MQAYPFAVHPKLSQYFLLIGYTPIQIKSFKNFLIKINIYICVCVCAHVSQSSVEKFIVLSNYMIYIITNE